MEEPSQMAELAAAAARELAEAPAQDVIAWATETFPPAVTRNTLPPSPVAA